MPESRRPTEEEIVRSPAMERAGPLTPEQSIKMRLFCSPEDAAAYEKWLTAGPSSLRQTLERHWLGRPVRPDRSAGPLAGEFLVGAAALLVDPDAAVSDLSISRLAQKQLSRLATATLSDGSQVNVWRALSDPAVSFARKWNYLENLLLPRYRWLAARDAEELKKSADELPEPDGIELTPEEEQETYTPHRVDQEQAEGEPGQAVAVIKPFFGGRYKDSALTHFNGQTLTWSDEPRQWRALAKQNVDAQRGRVYRALAGPDKRLIIKLPRGWGVDQFSLRVGAKAPDAQFFVDQNGVVSVTINSLAGSTAARLIIGPTNSPAAVRPPQEQAETASERLPPDALAKAQKIMAQDISSIVKARQIVALTRNRLEYDMDIKWEAVYKADIAAYFEKIWEHKKAKCDEANTLAARLLTNFGFKVKFLGGHSAQTKSQHGEALLLDSNRHAWIAVWDDAAARWEELDATPAGDPNVDHEEQEQELLEGEWEEQESRLMSYEELAAWKKKAASLTEAERPEISFAKQAGCSEIEALQTLGLISRLRVQHRAGLEISADYWERVVRANERERMIHTGPVPLSQGDDLEYPVDAALGIKFGERDPLGWDKETRRTETERIFGGYEVYLAVDLSGSMNETILGAKKADTQRDMAFLLIDNIMENSAQARQNTRLKAPMSVKVCLTVFGFKTEVALPLTSEWGPAEQVKLYRALDAGAGGGTPDHLALAMIEEQITASVKQEEDERQFLPQAVREKWRTRRFVVAVADGGSDNAAKVKDVNQRLQAKGIPVDLFLIADPEDLNLIDAANGAYQHVNPIANPKELAEKGIARLTERLQQAYDEEELRAK